MKTEAFPNIAICHFFGISCLVHDGSFQNICYIISKMCQCNEVVIVKKSHAAIFCLHQFWRKKIDLKAAFSWRICVGHGESKVFRWRWGLIHWVTKVIYVIEMCFLTNIGKGASGIPIHRIHTATFSVFVKINRCESNVLQRGLTMWWLNPYLLRTEGGNPMSLEPGS